tara:strand:+ start:863 stop:1177 length:315 start_codon:yes stop_codon:yes gene_type:complete
MKKIINIFLVFLFVSSCSSSGFTLKKKDQADEFLVEKKSPLVLPPNYGELPVPDGQRNAVKNVEEDEELNSLKVILGSKENNNSKKNNSTNSTSIEDSILKKIK